MIVLVGVLPIGVVAEEIKKASNIRDLSEVLETGFTGLSLEEEKIRTLILAQAREYVDFRKKMDRAQREAYRTRCESQTVFDNPFCEVMRTSAANQKARETQSQKGRTKLTKKIRAALEAKDLVQLSTFGQRDLSRAFEDLKNQEVFEKVGDSVLAAKSCDQSTLAYSLAGKFEEFLPDERALDRARQLFLQTARCEKAVDAQQARFRFSLLSIASNRCLEAEPELALILKQPDTSGFHVRAKYWRYHCAKIGGQAELMKAMQESLMKDHPMSFHNLVVNGKDPRLLSAANDLSSPKIKTRSLQSLELNFTIRAIEALIDLKETRLAADVTENSLESLRNSEGEVRLYVAALMHKIENALVKFRVLSSLFQESPQSLNRKSLSLLFPRWYEEHLDSIENQVDPFLVLALIRQESAFNVKARSRAGARGLMQVMPATARSIASVQRDRLYDPQTNIRVGTKYFLHRLERYNGDVELTLAAYNAGFSRVDRWVKRYPTDNKMLFVDLIPFRETREYVSSILRNYYWYVLLYSGFDIQELQKSESVPVAEKVRAILNANSGARPAPVPPPIFQPVQIIP